MAEGVLAEVSYGAAENNTLVESRAVFTAVGSEIIQENVKHSSRIFPIALCTPLCQHFRGPQALGVGEDLRFRPSRGGAWCFFPRSRVWDSLGPRRHSQIGCKQRVKKGVSTGTCPFSCYFQNPVTMG